MIPIDEKHMIRLAADGDMAAFEQLVTTHQPAIYRLALRMTGNPEDAADMTQEAFLRAWRGLGSFQADSSLSTWLFRLTSNVCIDFLRAARRHLVVPISGLDADGEEYTLDAPDPAKLPEEELLAREEREELRAVRTRLEALLGEKAERLKELGGTGGTRLAELDRALDALAAQRREVGEALHAGRQAEQALSGVLDSLDSAESWGTWDMLGGGLLTTMAKHGHLDDAQAGIGWAQQCLSRFRTELADVRDMELPQVQIGEFATFADYFFDGFFMDWMVQSKIQDAQEGVSEVHVRVLNALRNLERMDQELAEEQDGLKREREGLLLRSSGSD